MVWLSSQGGRAREQLDLHQDIIGKTRHARGDDGMPPSYHPREVTHAVGGGSYTGTTVGGVWSSGQPSWHESLALRKPRYVCPPPSAGSCGYQRRTGGNANMLQMWIAFNIFLSFNLDVGCLVRWRETSEHDRDDDCRG